MTDGLVRPPLSTLYREVRQRITALVGSGGADVAATPVPACPGWTVGDVVSHLVAVAEDAVAGRLTGPPDDAFTAAQVARFAPLAIPDRLSAWEEVAPAFEQVLDAFDVWPGMLDVAAHEQDIRGALGTPGARDCPAVKMGAEWLTRVLDPPVGVVVSLDDHTIMLGPESGTAAPIGLVIDHFEMFRVRLGRRSRSQIAGLAWSGDPTPVLASMTIFGPAAADIRE